MTTPTTATAVVGTSAGRPQPQTTAEPQGGPFIRHAPKGRRPIYDSNATFGQYFGPPIVAAPGWYTGYKLQILQTASSGTGGSIQASQAGDDAPESIVSLLQVKDAWGTNLLSGPGMEMLRLVQMLSGQFGVNAAGGAVRDPWNIPSRVQVTAASATFTASTYLPFEFTTAYGVIAAANAALLPSVQFTMNTVAALYGTITGPPTTAEMILDADFYWLPDVPADPPGIGTTCQWIYQPCNPPIPSSATQRVQLPRLGGYLTVLGLDLRDSTNRRGDFWASRPGVFVDGVEQINTKLTTWYDDLAVAMGIGSLTNSTQTGAGTAFLPRPTGILAVNRKTSLAQVDFGLLDTGEKFLSPLALDTLVPTTRGLVVMADIEPGMLVYGSDGEPTPVIGVSDIFTGRDCYRVTFEHGESFTADAEHQWPAFGNLVRTDQLLAGDVIGDHKVSGIELVASVPTRCLATGRDDHLFTIGMAGVLTKNTNPGTQIEINGAPWASISNTPATLNAIIGQVVPSGPLVQGLPEI